MHPIKAIVVKKNKPSVPIQEEVYDFGNEPLDEEELKVIKLCLGCDRPKACCVKYVLLCAQVHASYQVI